MLNRDYLVNPQRVNSSLLRRPNIQGFKGLWPIVTRVGLLWKMVGGTWFKKKSGRWFEKLPVVLGGFSL